VSTTRSARGDRARRRATTAKSVLLQPKDKLRYGRRLWADVKPACCSNPRPSTRRNEPIEQFAFTQISIGGKIDHDQLRPRFLRNRGAWNVENSGAVAASLDASGWTIKPELPASRK